jgi:hypothetical protein
MTNDDAKAIETGSDEGESCGASIEQHIVDVWVGLTTVGLGNCREVYRALLEVAEAVRQQGKFQTYVPQGGDFVPTIVKAAVQKAQAELKRKQQAQQAAQDKRVDKVSAPDGDFVFPSNMKKN